LCAWASHAAVGWPVQVTAGVHAAVGGWSVDFRSASKDDSGLITWNVSVGAMPARGPSTLPTVPQIDRAG
jgi:hypothetical protein